MKRRSRNSRSNSSSSNSNSNSKKRSKRRMSEFKNMLQLFEYMQSVIVDKSIEKTTIELCPVVSIQIINLSPVMTSVSIESCDLVICTFSILTRNENENTIDISKLNNNFCTKIVRGLGECVMRWVIDFAIFLEIPKINLIDQANIRMDDGRYVPYRLLRLKKSIDNNTEIPLLWEDVSYYRRFGFEDAQATKERINHSLFDEYFNPEMEETYFERRPMFLTLHSPSSQFIEYLQSWQIQAFLTSCLRYDETQDYSISQTQTSTQTPIVRKRAPYKRTRHVPTFETMFSLYSNLRDFLRGDFKAAPSMYLLDDIEMQIYDEDEDDSGIIRRLKILACNRVVLSAQIKAKTIIITNIDTNFCDDVSDPSIETCLVELILNFAKFARIEYVHLLNGTVIEIVQLNPNTAREFILRIKADKVEDFVRSCFKQLY